jgi:hemerythrin
MFDQGGVNVKTQYIWEDRYSVGNAAVDQQHQHLFELCNKIQDAAPSDGKKYVMELYRYTRGHFQAEELHMRSIGFPDLAEHRELHNQVIAQLNTLVEKFPSTKESMEYLVVFVAKWLTDHILTEDMKYFTFTHSGNTR